MTRDYVDTTRHLNLKVQVFPAGDTPQAQDQYQIFCSCGKWKTFIRSDYTAVEREFDSHVEKMLAPPPHGFEKERYPNQCIEVTCYCGTKFIGGSGQDARDQAWDRFHEHMASLPEAIRYLKGFGRD